MSEVDRWWEYSGPLCDDPAERVGEDPGDEQGPRLSALGNEPDWADIVDGWWVRR